ncbi:MAG: molybdenum cofactor guanylyltransferase [Chloroflexi bacterium]|nr:molybdenum cofactor guanylyltransferase [Chloroflexota bacterium]
MTPQATGVVLAGGWSARLGRDKARERIGDIPLLRRVVDAVACACAEVLLAGEQAGREEITLPAEVRWVPDIHPGRGPLGGLHAGLVAARHDYVLAVACDMPFLHPPLLELLVSLASGHEAVVPRVQGRLQTLHAVYARSCLPVVEGLLAGPGAPSLHDLVSHLRIRYVEEQEVRRLDPDLRSLFNINSEEDLALAQQALG